MKKNEIIENIVDLYYTFTKLKNLNRSGWLYWNLKNVRIESISEHIYGTICLALSIFANTNLDIDISKVIMMLALHETEEIYIGDITPFDTKELKTKKENGAKAVNKVFQNCKNKKLFLDLINEFEDNKTKESIFAHQVDRLEADLQALKYKNHFDFSKVSDKITKSEFIQECKKEELKDVHEMFIKHDKPLFTDITLEIANYIEKGDFSNELKEKIFNL